MRRKLKWALLIAGALWAGWTAYKQASAARDARDRAAYAALEAVVDSMRAHADTLERRLVALKERQRVDTIRLTRWRTRWDSTRNSAPPALDTSIHNVRDTMPALTVPVDQVRALITVADSTIAACGDAVTTCLQRADTAEALAATYKAALDTVQRGPKQPKPLWWKVWGKRLSQWYIMFRLGRASAS